MQKQDIISLFLKKGSQLDSGSLDFFSKSPDMVDVFFDKLGNSKAPLAITKEFVQQTLDHQKAEIEIIKQPVFKRGRSSSQDFAQYFSSRFDSLSAILTKKLSLMNVTSIGKINAKSKNFSLIGMVRDKDEDRISATIEDTTGSISLRFSEKASADYEQIVLDEIIGVICEKTEDVKASSVMWPDIPLRKTISKSNKEIHALFISDFHMDDSHFKRSSYEKFLDWMGKINYKNFYIFILGDVSGSKNDVNDLFGALPKSCYKIFVKGEIDPSAEGADMNVPGPTLLKIEDLYLLLSHGEFMEKYAKMWKDMPVESVLLNLLKKRHIDPIFDSNSRIYEEDPFLLDIVPDIFASGHFHSPSLLNYKGTTIISTGSFTTSPIFWTVDLKTRESIKVDFA